MYIRTSIKDQAITIDHHSNQYAISTTPIHHIMSTQTTYSTFCWYPG